MLTHPKSWIKDKVRKLILCLFTQHQEPVQLNRAIFTWQILIKHDMTPICKHFPFLYFTQWSQPVHSTRIPDFFFNKVEQSVRKACFCSYSLEHPLELKSQCLFQRSSNKKVWLNKTNTQQKGMIIQLQLQQQHCSLKSICCNGHNQRSVWPAQSNLDDSSYPSIKFV